MALFATDGFVVDTHLRRIASTLPLPGAIVTMADWTWSTRRSS
ncbi:MAG: hypothetical protein Q8O67_22545 [Deltaproteobacteria bacterium]|nr:hypothetical protein [Deltaproteobacteria bacterium]